MAKTDLTPKFPLISADEEIIVNEIQSLSDFVGGQSINTPTTVQQNHIQSQNFVTGVSGWQMNADGNLEANAGTFRGSLIAGDLHIPDQDTSANSFHTDTSGNTWWGATETNFNADNNNATAYVLNTGVAKFQNVILDTNVQLKNLSSGSLLSIQGWQFDGAFSATDLDTVAWGSGTLTFEDGNTYSITASNTGNIAARTYIYWDKAVSTTALQTTTTASTAVGANKVLVAVASPGTSEATFQVFGGTGGIKVTGADIENSSVDTAQMKADAITANELASNAVEEAKIAADAVTAAKIAVSGLDGTTGDVAANHIVANMLQTDSVTAVKIQADAVTAPKINVVGLDGTSGRIVVADATDADVVTGAINSYATTNISAGKIVISGATNLEDWRNATDLTKIEGGSIATNTITATQIKAGTITATEIFASTITTNEIASNTIVAGNMNVGQLSAIAADLGTVTAGSISINSGVASIDSAGAAVFKSIQIGGSTTQYTLNDNGIGNYGDGSDGSLTTSGNVTLTEDKYYTDLTVSAGDIFNPAGYRVFVSGTLTINGRIERNGNDGGTGKFGTGGRAAGGVGGAALADGYLKGSLKGGDGGDGSSTLGNNNTVENGVSVSNSIGSGGSLSGNGGAGSTTAGLSRGTSGTATTSNVKLIANWHLNTLLDVSSSGSTVKFDNSASSGGAGAGGGGTGANDGYSGSGGGAASNGGIIAIYAKKIIINSENTTGYLYKQKTASIVANDSTVGLTAWSDTEKALTQESVGANVNNNTGAPSYYLKFTDYNFNIPSELTIIGIKVSVLARLNSVNKVKDNSVRLVKGGVISGNDNTQGYSWNSNVNWETRSFGGSTDLWGLSLTPADINASNFGVVFSETYVSDSASGMLLDYIYITVYTAGGGIFSMGGDGGQGGGGYSLSASDGGGGGGGAASNGGQIILVYNEITNNGIINVNAGKGGRGGKGAPLASDGADGADGTAGTIRQFNISL